RAVTRGLPFALGAGPTTEAGDGGDFITAHLDRGGGKWRQLAGLPRLAGAAARAGKPAVSGEAVRAAGASQPRRPAADPAFFFALAALSRLLELGTVFHSEDGLHARPLGQNQRTCAAAFVAGFRSIETDVPIAAVADQADSPVASVQNAAGVWSATAGN